MGKKKGNKKHLDDDDWEAEADLVEAVAALVVDPEVMVTKEQHAPAVTPGPSQCANLAAERAEAAEALSRWLSSPPPAVDKAPISAETSILDQLLEAYIALNRLIENAKGVHLGTCDDATTEDSALMACAAKTLDALIDSADAAALADTKVEDEQTSAKSSNLTAHDVDVGGKCKVRKSRKNGKRKDAEDDWEDEADILYLGGHDCASTHSENSASLASVRVAALAKAKAAKDEAAGGFKSMRTAYDELGADAYYEAHGCQYTNPHEPLLAAAMHTALDAWRKTVLGVGPLRRGLDFACGSGEATAAFVAWDGSNGCAMEASDPYTYQAYEKRMGKPAHRWSFEAVSGGVLDEIEPYDIIVSSFALHLIEPSYLYTTLAALARSSRLLLVLTPHKRPVIDPATGWREEGEMVTERVRVRLYVSETARRPSRSRNVE